MSEENKKPDPKEEVGSSFDAVMRHAKNPKAGGIDPRRLDALEGRYGSNGGRGCDVRSGPCSCGAWHQ